MPPVTTFGRYTLFERLTHDDVMELFAAQRTGTPMADEVVALTKVARWASAEEAANSGFVTEFQRVAALNHAAIAPLFEFGVHEGSPFVVTEYVPGKSLASLLEWSVKRGELVDADVALFIARRVCDALDHAHGLGQDAPERSVVHGELSGRAVRITFDGVVKVTRFGVAVVRRKAPPGPVRAAPVPEYGHLSPEHLAYRGVDGRSDVFSLGTLLYELLTAKPAFRDPNVMTTLRNILSAAPVPLRTLNPAVPVELERVVLRALSAQPAKRHQSASALRADLERCSTEPEQLMTQRLSALMKVAFAEDVLAERARRRRYRGEEGEQTATAPRGSDDAEELLRDLETKWGIGPKR